MLSPEDVGRSRIDHHKRSLRAVGFRREDRSWTEDSFTESCTGHDPPYRTIFGFLGALVRQDQLVSRNASCSGGWLRKSLKRLTGLRKTGETTSRRICVPQEIFYACENEISGFSTVWRSNNRKVGLLQPRTWAKGTCESKKMDGSPGGRHGAKTPVEPTCVSSKRLSR